MTPKRAVVYVTAKHQLAFAKLEMLASQRGVKVNELVGEAIERYVDDPPCTCPPGATPATPALGKIEAHVVDCPRWGREVKS